MSNDTIAALATPPGRASVGIVRVSGDAVPQVARALLGQVPEPRLASLMPFLDKQGEMLDQGIAIYFKAPHSFTGEDVLELQAHGGPVVLDLLLQAVLAQGVRLALPGEFSQRAFLNDKLDLTQAEAIADLITAGSEQAARAAMRSMQGAFSTIIEQLLYQLVEIRIWLEANFDFPEEDIEQADITYLLEKTQHLKQHIQDVLQQAESGQRLQQGMTIILVGAPNAGKSSLLNCLSGQATAIVTHLPGTTRDILRAEIVIQGCLIELIDTAGLRASDDVIEQEGIKRALVALEQADHVLWVCDATDPQVDPVLAQYPELQTLPYTRLINKIDLEETQAEKRTHEGETTICLSAKTGDGLDLLKKRLQEVAGNQTQGGSFSARRRHIQALKDVLYHIKQAEDVLQQQQASELAAESFRYAQHALSEITGSFSTEDLLGEIFSSFCIGK